MTEQNAVVNTDASDDVLPELTQEQILGNAAAEYVKLEAKVAEVKAQLKASKLSRKTLRTSSRLIVLAKLTRSSRLSVVVRRTSSSSRMYLVRLWTKLLLRQNTQSSVRQFR